MTFPEEDLLDNDAATARALLQIDRPTFCHIGCRSVSNGILLSGVNAWGSGGSLPNDGDQEIQVGNMQKRWRGNMISSEPHI